MMMTKFVGLVTSRMTYVIVLSTLFKCAKLITGPLFWLLALRSSKKLEAPRDPLLQISATCLARKIRRKEITSEELVRAYVERLREVNHALNAIVDDRFAAAIKDAKDVDEFLRTTKLDEDEIYKQKPLLGIPLTVKESCKLKGLSFAVGCKTRLGFVADEDGEAVLKLKEAGAIPLLVSNTPEICFGMECDNYITGTTNNPYNTNYTCGGSSGGEAALISSGASVIGLGSDIGGSIRVPCMFNGIFGHKPSPGVVPIGGHYPMCADQNFYDYLSIGPMVRYAEDMRLLMKAMADGDCVNLDEKVDLDKVVVFFMEDIGPVFYMVPVADEIKNALLQCVEYLRGRHLTISDVKFEELAGSFEMSVSRFFSMENRPDMFVDQNNPEERYSFPLEFVKFLFARSTVCYNSLAYYILDKSNDVMSKAKDPHLEKLSDSVKARMAKQLGDYGVFLYPTFHCPAFQHKQTLFNAIGITYSMVFNLLGFPSTHVPLGLNGKGLPVGVQVVAGPHRDAVCLAVAEELEKGFGGWTPPW